MIHWTELEGCPIRKEIVAASSTVMMISSWPCGMAQRGGISIVFTLNADRNYKCFRHRL